MIQLKILNKLRKISDGNCVFQKKTRVILQGDYDSGQTVIALKKIQLVLKTIQGKETTCYVSFHAKCELHHVIKQ